MENGMATLSSKISKTEADERRTPNPKPKTTNHKPQTTNLNPQSPIPNPQSLNPQPEILNPKPEIRNPKPETRAHTKRHRKPVLRNDAPRVLRLVRLTSPGQTWNFHTQRVRAKSVQMAWRGTYFQNPAWQGLHFPTLLACFPGKINFTRRSCSKMKSLL
ncbi:hypothetical protein T484DRAFT_3627702 [Baffinella frigidus]|nr:hypothetical protein T484DRAFT_3627702 [Cryptophyta sp. CCMP2293]